MTGAAVPDRAVHRTPVPLVPEECPIVAVSPAMKRAVGLALRFAPTLAAVLGGDKQRLQALRLDTLGQLLLDEVEQLL